MALVLIRGENNSKLLNAIADMERHGNLNLACKPKMIDSRFADKLVEGILHSKLKTKSKVATAFFIKEDTTLSIMQIKKIHPPAHVVIVSDEYDADATQAIEKLLALMEPVLILFLGLVVGIIVIAVLLPIYSMYSSF